MKYYQVVFADQYDAGFCGVLPGFYTSKEEAEKAAEWERKHPDAFMNVRVGIQELDLSDVRDKFVPPMTEEAYNEYIARAYEPQEQECYDESEYDPEYIAYLEAEAEREANA